MLDTVEILSHDSFANLLKNAAALLEETLGDRIDEATVVNNPTPGLHKPGTAVTANPAAGGTPTLPTFDPATTTAVDFQFAGPAATDPNQLGLFDEDDDQSAYSTTHTGLTIATLEARQQVGAGATEVLTRTYKAREPGGVRLPLFMPMVVTKWVRDPFSLTQVNLLAAEDLGRKFANDNAPTLTRKALDAERDEEGHTHVVIHDAEGAVAATQMTLPFDSIENDLVTRLMHSNAVEATVTEANAASAVAQAFLRGANVTDDTPWRAEHGRLATTRLVEWIDNQRTSSPAREVRTVEPVRWPDTVERVETKPPANRHVVTSRQQFEKWYPYSGWEKAVYEVNSFDAYSTEFLLASLFERDDAVKAWVRVDQSVPLRINYLIGAVQKTYEPDFVVIDSDGTQWVIEGKADTEMTSDTVIAKRDAARAWINTVNADPNVHQKWGYILASESVIASASTWQALRAGAQTFQ